MTNTETQSDSKKRFSDRVDDYVKYRPSYPEEIINYLEDLNILQGKSIIADVGSGTGILTKLFLDHGNKVYGIEPNTEMRIAGENFLKEFDNFQSIIGSSENTNLPDHSIDLITAGQAYHWFNVEETAKEFKRILKDRNKDNIILIWNTRTEIKPFNKELEELIKKYSKDYNQVSQTQDKNKAKNIFFNKEFKKKIFPNNQILSFEALLGRLQSASYMIKKNDFKYEQFYDELSKLFHKHEKNGFIILEYETEVFYGNLD